MLVAWETLNIFLLPGISKINIFFEKKKNNVVVNSNSYDYCAPRPAEQSEAGRGAFYFSAYSDLYQVTTG